MIKTDFLYENQEKTTTKNILQNSKKKNLYLIQTRNNKIFFFLEE